MRKLKNKKKSRTKGYLLLGLIIITLLAISFNLFRQSNNIGTGYATADGSFIQRQLSSQTIQPGQSVNVTLRVNIGTDKHTYYLIEETFPLGWNISREGNGSVAGNVIRWIYLDETLGANSTNLVYEITAPATTGEYTFTGIYMLEGMTNETLIEGSNSILVRTEESAPSQPASSGGGGGGGGGGSKKKITNSTLQKKGTLDPVLRKEISEQEGKQLACPENCNCSDLSTECKTIREATIIAENFDKTIIRSDGVEMTTSLVIYKEQGEIYAALKNGQSIKLNLLPDQVKAKVEEELGKSNESYFITLENNGVYKVKTYEQVKLFSFMVKKKVIIKINPETGEIKSVRGSWWAIFAKKIEAPEVLGASCGTVTPGYNDECCKTKGYDYWNTERQECTFYIE